MTNSSVRERIVDRTTALQATVAIVLNLCKSQVHRPSQCGTLRDFAGESVERVRRITIALMIAGLSSRRAEQGDDGPLLLAVFAPMLFSSRALASQISLLKESSGIR